MKGRPIKSGNGLRAEQRSGGRGGASMKGRPLRDGDSSASGVVVGLSRLPR